LTTFEKFCLSAWLKIVSAAICAVLAGCGASVANAQQRGGMVTISPDGSVAATAPSVNYVSIPKRLTFGYPVRGNHWTYPGNSRSALIYHLQTGEHAGKFSRAWLDSLSYQELLSLHDDDHEHRVKSPRYAVAVAGYRTVSVPLSASTVRAIDRADRKAEKDLGRAVWGTRDGRHPGPVGAAIRGWFGDPRYRAYCPTGNCPYR